MHIVSVINYKGGVGKTTVTANLAAGLADRKYNVLLLDMDPQCSLTFSFYQPDEWDASLKNAKTIKAWFDSLNNGSSPTPLADLIKTPPRVASHLLGKGKLDLIASHLGLINVDLELATQIGGGSLTQTKKNYLRVHRRLADGLAQLQGNPYDIVLIDCPPNFNITTKNAIVASNSILIPAKPDYLSTLGIDYLKRSLASLVKEFNEFIEIENDGTISPIDPKIAGVVFTMIQINSGIPISPQRPFMAQTKNLGIPVFEQFIRENKSIFGDSPQYGVPVVMNNYSNPTHAGVVEEIDEFVTEFTSAVGLKRHE